MKYESAGEDTLIAQHGVPPRVLFHELIKLSIQEYIRICLLVSGDTLFFLGNSIQSIHSQRFFSLFQ